MPGEGVIKWDVMKRTREREEPIKESEVVLEGSSFGKMSFVVHIRAAHAIYTVSWTGTKGGSWGHQ